MALLTKIPHPVLPFAVVIEDDGNVAYAYLLEHGKIVGDVWLYNCGPAPEEPEWRDPQKAPFRNPKSYTKDELFSPVSRESDVQISWAETPNTKSLDAVVIKLRQSEFALLTPNSKPGWCRLARKDGPLAKVLREGSKFFVKGQ